MKARDVMLSCVLCASLCTQAQVKVSLVDLSKDEIGAAVAAEVASRMRRIPQALWVDNPKAGGIEARLSSMRLPRLEPDDPQFVAITVTILMHSESHKMWPGYMGSRQKLCAEPVVQQCADALFDAVEVQVNNVLKLVDVLKQKR